MPAEPDTPKPKPGFCVLCNSRRAVTYEVESGPNGPFRICYSHIVRIVNKILGTKT